MRLAVEAIRSQKLSKDHQIVGIDDKPSSEELLKQTKTYCDQHKTKEIDILLL